jgi:hypothetical protein
MLAACGGGSSSSSVSTGGGGGGGGGGGTSSTGNNYTTCSSQQVPNWRASAFISNYQPAIQALINHYATNASIGYIRIGLGKGGEINLPQGWNDSSSGFCYTDYTTNWGYTVGSDSSSTWNAYLQSMVQYEGSLASPKELLVSITPVTGAGVEVDDFIAPVAVSNGMSFGNQGLEASDITNFNSGGICGGDWCGLFMKYPNTPIRELQTLGQSCPATTSGTCPNSLSTSTGPLDPLIPFAIAHGSNDLELYYQDWLITYDASYAGSLGVTSAATAAYQAAFGAAALTPGVSLQVLFPPQSGDTDYSSVQTYLMTNPAVAGTVIDVDWSDFDIGGASAGTHTNYDFTITDAAIQPWIQAGKTVNLVLQNTTYGGGSGCPSSGIGSNGNVGSNCAMPPWMWTALSQ